MCGKSKIIKVIFFKRRKFNLKKRFKIYVDKELKGVKFYFIRLNIARRTNKQGQITIENCKILSTKIHRSPSAIILLYYQPSGEISHF